MATATTKHPGQQVKVRDDLPAVWTCAESHNPDRGIYRAFVAGQTYLRRDSWETCFVGSKRFPAGLRLGYTEHMVQPDRGQPYAEQAIPQCGLDAFEMLAQYAAGKPVVTLEERRRKFDESLQRREEMAALANTDLQRTASLLNRAADLKKLEESAAPKAPAQERLLP